MKYAQVKEICAPSQQPLAMCPINNFVRCTAQNCPLTNMEEKNLEKIRQIKKEVTTVWIYEKRRIFKKQCEEIGYPNTTTDGYLMYNNTTFKSKKEALKYARQSTAIEWRYLKEVINWKRIKFFFESLADFIYIRIIQPFKQ